MPKTPLYSPKDSELRQSLEKVATRVAITPTLAPAAPPSGFTLNLTVSNGLALVGWQGGVQPVQLQKTYDLSTWNNEGPPTIRTLRTVAANSAAAFFRVRQAIPLLSVQTNSQRLIWFSPEIDMNDTYDHFVLERSSSGVIADALSNGTLNDPITAVATLRDKTTLTADHVVPAIGSQVTVAVADSAWMKPGDYVNEPGKGIYLVVSTPDPVSAILQYDPINNQLPNVSHSGETASSGSQIVPGSYKDSTVPTTDLFYRLSAVTANGVTAPFNVTKVSAIVQTSALPGDALWAHMFSGADVNPVTSRANGDVVGIDPRDNSVIVAGKYWADIDFEGANPLFSAGNYSKTLIAKYTAAGVLTTPLPKSLGNNVPNFIMGLGVDSTGSIFLAGHFSIGPTSLGGPDLAYSGATDLMIGKLDQSFNHLWSRSIGSFGSDLCGGCCLDSAGHLWVTGSQQGTVDFGNGFVLTGGAFLARFDKTDGHTLWAGNIPGGIGTSVAADLVNNFIAVSCNYNITVSKYSLTGVQQWTHSLGSGNDGVNAVAFDNAGNVLFGGQFFGSKSFGGPVRTASPSPGSSAFCVMLSPSGSYVWDQVYSLTAFNYPWLIRSIKVDATGAVIIAGHALESETIEGQFLATQGFWSPIVLKYSQITTVASLAWVKRIQGQSDNFVPYSATTAIDTTNRILVGGNFGYTISFVGTGGITTTKTNTGTGGTAGFIAQFQP